MSPVTLPPLILWAWTLFLALAALASSANPAPAASVRVTGKVVDADTGKPVGKFVEQDGRVDPADPAKVLWGTSEGRTESANPEGNLRLTIDWEGGHRVRLLADGYLPQPVLEQAPPKGAETVEVIVKLRRGRELSGTVLDAKGRPVAGAGVFLIGKRAVNLTGGKAVRAFDGVVDETVTRASTAADGHFTIRGAGDDVDRLAVSGPALDLWVIPVPKDDGKPLAVRLPEPATMALKYDIAGGPDEATFLLQLHTYEMPGWIGIDNLIEPKVKNGGAVTLANLAPGAYEVTRRKAVQIGEMGRNVLCDRQTITIKPGEAATASFVRDRGASVTGRVEGFDRDKFPGAFVSVRPAKATGNPFAVEELFGPCFDFSAMKPDGSFATERLLPGEYTVVVEAYAPRPRDGRLSGGLDTPALVGVARVTVPAEGKPEPVVVTLKAPVRPGAN